MRTFAVIYILVAALSSHAENLIQQDLKEFHQNPRNYMDRLPSEVRDGKLINRGAVIYRDDARFAEKLATRELIARRSSQVFRPQMVIGEADRPQSLTDNPNLVTSIREIHNLGLMRSELEVKPWADSYWPIAKGLVGIRYADPSFPRSKNWIENYNAYLAKPTFSVVNSGNTQAINNLSPAEKYDLLVGDPNMSMTNYSWNLGKKYYDKNGFVETWMGICHGWSAAAHMMAPVIAKPVVLRTPGGLPITFYQSDVKALTSLLWANAPLDTRFVGARCKTPRPPRDAYGRILDTACLDTNPGTFHLTLVNQLGINKRSFVMDSTYDAQVWNFAVASYHATYFNPQNLNPTPSLDAAVIPVEQFTIDKFKAYRSPDTRYVVGVAIDVSHVNAVNPSHGTMTKTPLKTLRFIYDLELDANQNIIGGEWYMNAHPDFLWTYAPGARAVSRADGQLNLADWTQGGAVPSSWIGAAQQASSAGMPLAAIVDRIVESAPGREGSDSGGAIVNTPRE